MTNRLIKAAHEIASIEKACNLGDRTFDYILTKIKEGVSEKELAFEIKHFIKKHKAKTSFPPIVAFSKNSAFPHHKPTNQKLVKNQQIKIDLGVKLNNYCSDMTRTVFFGSASAEYKKMYQTVLDAQKNALEVLGTGRTRLLAKNVVYHLRGGSVDHLEGGSPKRSEGHDSFEVDSRGIKASSVDKVARDHITSKGYPTIPHSLGHGIGLEVHEAPIISPKSKDTLNIGMVFTIEPGIYLPGFWGIRIEDVVVLEKSGLRLLTHAPKNLIEL
jgi:Xaa-Pro aminopeptidase